MLPILLVLAWYTLPIFTYAIARCLKERMLLLILIPLTMVVGYFLVIATVMAADGYDAAKMASFDLNGDGRIEGIERTKEVSLAIDAQSQDTGRALAPITAIPLTAVWYTLLYGVLFGADWAIRKLFFRKQSSRNTIASPDHSAG